MSNLKQLREARGWSIVKLAEESGIKRNTISQLEKRTRFYRPGEKEKLAEALGVKPEDITE